MSMVSAGVLPAVIAVWAGMILSLGTLFMRTEKRRMLAIIAAVVTGLGMLYIFGASMIVDGTSIGDASRVLVVLVTMAPMMLVSNGIEILPVWYPLIVFALVLAWLLRSVWAFFIGS